MTADTTLAPCPFCDSPARQSQGGEGAAAWFGTGCGGSQSCPAYLRGLVHKSQAAADAAWNRRAQAPAPQQPAALYRLLQADIDRIEATDEFLSGDATTWAIDPGGVFVGMPYAARILRPARRAIKGDA